MNAAKGHAALLLGLLFAVPAHAVAPQVVASIAPIHSLAASVMRGVGEPDLIVPAEVSSHDYAMKPSDVRKIAGADLVVWVGPSLEAYLVKPLETEGVAQLELLEAPGVDPHAYESEDHAHEYGADTEEHETGSTAAVDHEEHMHEHLGLDPHIWLDPLRAAAIVEVVAARLAEMDATNADTYQANARETVTALKALDGDIRKKLASSADKPFVTFHDGYSYFVERYGLTQVGEIAIHPERRPGAASLRELRATIAAEGVACAFTEPQFDPAMIRSLAGDSALRVSSLDPLGTGLEPGPMLYETLLHKNADAIASCLSATS